MARRNDGKDVLALWQEAIEEGDDPVRALDEQILARRRGLLKDGRHERVKADLEEISKMLSGLIKGLDQRSV